MTDCEYQTVGTLIVHRGLTPVQALHAAATITRQPVGRPTLPQSQGLAQAYLTASRARPLLVSLIVLGGQVYPVEARGYPPSTGLEALTGVVVTLLTTLVLWTFHRCHPRTRTPRPRTWAPPRPRPASTPPLHLGTKNHR